MFKRKSLALTKILVLMSVIFYSCDDLIMPDTDDKRDLIIDTWTCNEESKLLGESAYTIDISKDYNDSTQIILDNFYNLGFGKSIIAKYSNNYISIKNQECDNFIFNGSGNVKQNNNLINFLYTVKYQDGDIDTVKATLTRM